MAGLKEEDLRPSVSVDTVAADHDPSSTLSESCPHTCTQVVTVVLLYTGIADMFEVKMFLKNFNDWLSLGLALGVLYPTLERIEEEQRGAIEKCKTKMIAAWLQRQDNASKNGVPTWMMLQTALRKIGENVLADKI